MSKLQIAIIGFLGLIACVVIAVVSVIAGAVLSLGNVPAAPPPGPTNTPAPTSTLAPSSTPILYKWEGEGDDVLFFDVSYAGPGFLSASFTGDGTFFITLYRGDGQYVDLLVNALEAYEGQTTYRIRQPGQYYLEIKASGHDFKPNWIIVMAPPQ